MSIRTRSLFHFTSRLEILKLILQAGYFWPKYSLEDYSWSGKASALYLGIPMTCFCDIPLSRIQYHTNYYGKYGMGLSQEWGLRNGLNPLVYVNENSAFKSTLDTAHNALIEKQKHSGKVDLDVIRESVHLLAYTKPFRGSTSHSGKPETKYFYEESEWRYIPPKIFEGDQFALDSDEMSDVKGLEKANQAVLESGALAFNLNDIRYIFVPNISEIPLLYDHINANLGMHPHNELKVLISKIFSLERLMEDV